MNNCKPLSRLVNCLPVTNAYKYKIMCIHCWAWATTSDRAPAGVGRRSGMQRGGRVAEPSRGGCTVLFARSWPAKPYVLPGHTNVLLLSPHAQEANLSENGRRHHKQYCYTVTTHRLLPFGLVIPYSLLLLLPLLYPRPSWQTITSGLAACWPSVCLGRLHASLVVRLPYWSSLFLCDCPSAYLIVNLSLWSSVCLAGRQSVSLVVNLPRWLSVCLAD